MQKPTLHVSTSKKSVVVQTVPDLPRPMEINLVETHSRVKELEDGERVPEPFKHWRRKRRRFVPGCNVCGQNAGPTLRARIRSSIYEARASSMVCFYPEMNEDIWSGMEPSAYIPWQTQTVPMKAGLKSQTEIPTMSEKPSLLTYLG